MTAKELEGDLGPLTYDIEVSMALLLRSCQKQQCQGCLNRHLSLRSTVFLK